MALFNSINRRIKSMQEGGQPFGGNVVMPEVDDGSIGGFNRPELRGLRKQARRGTLTNRERRRLNYLTNEAKGRRRRGLLSGLGGAAAALGAAALIKGGGAKGLMDSIKSRIGGEERKEGEEGLMDRFKGGLERWKEHREYKKNPLEQIDPLQVPTVDKPEQSLELPIKSTDVGEIPSSDESPFDEDYTEYQYQRDRKREADEYKREQIEEANKKGWKVDEKTVGGFYEGKLPREEWIYGEDPWPLVDRPTQTYSTQDMLDALQNAESSEQQQLILDKMGATKFTPNPKAMERLEGEIENTIGLKRGTSFGEPIDPDDPLSPKTRTTIMRGSRGPLNPDDFAEEDEVDLPSDTEQMLQGLSKGIDPAVLGAVRGGGGQDLASKIDPEGLVQGDDYGDGVTREEGAARLLQTINRTRADAGLPPATQLTKELVDFPTGRIETLNPRRAGQIQSSVEEPFGGTLPQLGQQSGELDISMPDGSDAPPGASMSRSTAERQMKPGQVIRSYEAPDGTRVYYPVDPGKTTQAVGGMVKRLMNRYR